MDGVNLGLSVVLLIIVGALGSKSVFEAPVIPERIQDFTIFINVLLRVF